MRSKCVCTAQHCRASMSLLDGLASTGLWWGPGPAVQQEHAESGDADVSPSIGPRVLRYGVLNGGKRPATGDRAWLPACLPQSSVFLTGKKDGKADGVMATTEKPSPAVRSSVPRAPARPRLPCCCLPNTFSFETMMQFACNAVWAVTRFHLDILLGSQNNVSTAAA
ncbi:hypothetical protein GUJ93_ZPchr0151g33458 [Zizania palustris]|uniref:Uncharacterized protein n=1 Tax=Zizania palustris TaxID=103762 RepID=A0A8J5V367_ZIZPA|nr:hypothetical protein GUJ93_ZPchr0151g33458 [Zizania palustris]